MINNFSRNDFSFLNEKFLLIFKTYSYKAFNISEPSFVIVIEFSERRDRASETTFALFIL